MTQMSSNKGRRGEEEVEIESGFMCALVGRGFKANLLFKLSLKILFPARMDSKIGAKGADRQRG